MTQIKPLFHWVDYPVNFPHFPAVLRCTSNPEFSKSHDDIARIEQVKPDCFLLYLKDDKFCNVRMEFGTLRQARSFVHYDILRSSSHECTS